MLETTIKKLPLYRKLRLTIYQHPTGGIMT